MASHSEIVISKFDAAKRQCEVAIRLYFAWGDPVAIHTLAAAAFNVLADINTHRGNPPPRFRNELLERVKPEHRKDVSKKLREAENFFKHADRDADAVLPFRPQASEFVLIEAVELYFSLTRELPPLLQTFRAWWLIDNKHMLKDDAPDEMKRALYGTPFTTNDRAAFFQKMLPIFSQANVS